MKERDFRIDLLRAFACIMVLFCHAPQAYEGQGGVFLVGVNNYFGMAWGPILFFAITGICTLNKVQEALPFLKKRFTRILAPTLVWSICYICLQCFVWNTCSSTEFFKMLSGMLVKPQYGSLWFMYALVSIYLIIPILSQWVNRCTPNEIKLYLCLWGICLCLPYIRVFGVDTSPLLDSNGMLFYMSGFLWCTVAGIYCRTYVRINLKSIGGVLISLFVLSSPIIVFIIKYMTGISITSSLTICSMLTTLYAVVLFYSIDVSWLKENRLLSLLVNNISKYSFGIYLCHMCFLHPFRIWIGEFGLNYAFQIPITAIVIGLLSFCVTWFIFKLPGSKYIIG